MSRTLNTPQAADGDHLAPGAIRMAVASGGLRYDDGSTQTFDTDGSTIYIENGRPTYGEWYVDENGRFCSFWPPTYRACYELTWLVEDGKPTGLHFTEINNRSRFDGRYQ